jgi:Fe2+ or Zn2+ uptake regulation protein
MPPVVEGRLPAAEDLLRQQGMRLTPQRRHVLGLFLEQPGIHWTADQVRQQLLPVLPELARGTTYNTLHELVRHGVLEEIPGWDGSLLYGLRLRPHHHFSCTRCRRWFDIEVEGIETLRPRPPQPDALVTEVQVTVHGICETCRRQDAAGQPPSLPL